MDDFESDFASITKKPLKLGSNKNKRTSNIEPIQPGCDIVAAIPKDAKVIINTKTKAEQAFESKQQKIVESRILKKASKTHKQRVEEFNKHLDSLSEHHDIPKVSWTK